MAIVMAQLGGIGVLHRNLTIEEQCAAVRQVKRFESGMVVNPITIAPDATLAEAQAIMADNAISGIPVVEAERQAGRASSPTATCALPTIPSSRCPN